MSSYKEYKRAHTILNILSSYEMKVDFNKNILSCGVFIVRFDCLESGLEEMLCLIERTQQ